NSRGVHACPQMDDNLEEAFRENLSLRRQLMSEVAKAGEPVTLGQKMGKWWRFGRTEDQQLVFALLLVLIAYRPLLLFLVGVGGEPIRMNGVGSFSLTSPTASSTSSRVLHEFTMTVAHTFNRACAASLDVWPTQSVEIFCESSPRFVSSILFSKE